MREIVRAGVCKCDRACVFSCKRLRRDRAGEREIVCAKERERERVEVKR